MMGFVVVLFEAGLIGGIILYFIKSLRHLSPFVLVAAAGALGAFLLFCTFTIGIESNRVAIPYSIGLSISFGGYIIGGVLGALCGCRLAIMIRRRFDTPFVRRSFLIALITLVILQTVGSAIYFDGEYQNYREPMVKNSIKLGLIPEHNQALNLAFKTLVKELRKDPKVSSISVEWKRMTFSQYLFSDYYHDIDNGSEWLEYDYDKLTGEGSLTVLSPINGPSDFDWRNVTPQILLSIADAKKRFQRSFLLRVQGCPAINGQNEIQVKTRWQHCMLTVWRCVIFCGG